MGMKTNNMKPMLARSYSCYNPEGWWMSEKLDGVRAVWTGCEFISRNGKTFPAPQELIDSMPSGVILDGELFGGRGKFQATVGKVRRGDWSGITYEVFDVINDKPFEARQATLSGLDLPAWCNVVEQAQCLSDEHLMDYEVELIKQGAEGVMIRKPGSLYQHKRSDDLQKIKRGHTAEAVVTGYHDGEGRNAGRVGALVAEFCGQVFKIGSGLSDEERDNPPAIGSLVTFSFFEFTDGGKPRFPIFVGVRDYE